MMDKDKIFLVFYVDVREVHHIDLAAFLKAVADSFKYDESVSRAIIPVKSESRVECINPALLTDEQYKEVEEKIAKLQIDFEEALKKLKDE